MATKKTKIMDKSYKDRVEGHSTIGRVLTRKGANIKQKSLADIIGSARPTKRRATISSDPTTQILSRRSPRTEMPIVKRSSKLVNMPTRFVRSNQGTSKNASYEHSTYSNRKTNSQDDLDRELDSDMEETHDDQEQENDNVEELDDNEVSEAEDNGENEQQGDDENDEEDENVEAGVWVDNGVNVENRVNHEASNRKPRGRTRCLKLVGINREERPKVILNKFNQPVGPSPLITHLSPLIGSIARTPTIVPLNYKSWTVVPPTVKNAIWTKVNQSFDIDDKGKKWVLKTASDSWKGFKSYLKRKYYTPLFTFQSQLDNIPPEIPPMQWKWLVSYWSDSRTKIRAEKNRESSKKSKNRHRVGSKSFARVAHDEFLDTGEELSMVDLFIKTRSNSNGVYIDKEVDDELKRLANDPFAAQDYITTTVLKQRPGRVPLRGKGITPSYIKTVQREEEIKKEAEGKIEIVQAECKAEIEFVEAKLMHVITNLVSKLKSTLQDEDISSLDLLDDWDVENHVNVKKNHAVTTILSPLTSYNELEDEDYIYNKSSDFDEESEMEDLVSDDYDLEDNEDDDNDDADS